MATHNDTPDSAATKPAPQGDALGSPGATTVVDAPTDAPVEAGEPAFDAFHPPSASLIADCVHCGFCLPSCPTYVLWGEEMDSPRGRIYLMNAGLQGEPLSDSMVEHFDACLGCLACVSACPSGVQYGSLIESTRAQVERRHERPVAEKALRNAIFEVFTRPERLRLLRGPLRVYQKSGMSGVLRRSTLFSTVLPRLAAMEAAAPQIGTRVTVPERTPATGARRGVVGLLLGCVQREFFPDVNAATARILAAEGFDVIAPRRQGCCGALSVHQGRREEAVEFARRLIDSFEQAGVDHIVVNSAGCGASMKEYEELLADDPAYAERAAAFSRRVRDLAEFLVDVGPMAPRHPLDVTVAYHDACHLSHGQGVRAQPRALLRGIPGVELREVPEGDLCCGSAGVYSLLNPEPARELGDRKAANVAGTGATLLVTANPGCLMQIGGAMQRAEAPIALTHTAQILDASIRGLSPEELLANS